MSVREEIDAAAPIAAGRRAYRLNNTSRSVSQVDVNAFLRYFISGKL